MTNIRLEHLIFTRVEPAYSPKRKSGFQTVYHSASLSSTDISYIEMRVQCFQPKRADIIRYQFFVLNSNSVVLTHSKKIKAHPKITDKNQRDGAFIAHALILSRQTFSQLGNNPFFIFDQYNDFVIDAEQMVEEYGQATGIIPETFMEFNKNGDSTTSTWPNLEVYKLVTIALQAENLLQKSKTVVFVGSEVEVHETLKTIFTLTPTSNRLACTFDSYADGCSIKPGLYWAIGSENTQGGNNTYIQINTKQKKVIDNVINGIKSNDLYLSWLDYASKQSNFKDLISHASSIQEISKAFTNRTHIQTSDLDVNACEDFFSLYKNRVLSGLSTLITQLVGKDFAIPLSNHLYKNIPLPELLSLAAAQTFPPPKKLSSFIVDWYLFEKPEVNEQIWKKFFELSQREKHLHLAFLSATLGKKIDSRLRGETLQQMTANEYREILVHLLDPIAPSYFVVPKHLPLLLQNDRLDEMSSEQFLELMEQIFKESETGEFDTLIKHVNDLDTKQLDKLEKMLRKKSNVSTTFMQTVDKKREELGKLPFFSRFI